MNLYLNRLLHLRNDVLVIFVRLFVFLHGVVMPELLVTFTTDIGLETAVGHLMVLEAGCFSKALGALVARVRLVAGMGTNVALKMGLLSERFTACVTRIRFNSCVCHLVKLQARRRRKVLPTILAPIGFDSRVDPHVIVQVFLAGKNLAAVSTLVLVDVAHHMVRGYVRLQVQDTLERDVVTVVTGERRET